MELGMSYPNLVRYILQNILEFRDSPNIPFKTIA